MGFSLTVRIALTIFVVFLFTIGLTVLLNLHKFDQLLTQVLRDRLAFTVEDIASNLETRLNLGLPLGSMRDVQDLLETRRGDDPAVLSIEVFDPEGRVLFGTDRSFIGDLISPRWLETFQDRAAMLERRQATGEAAGAQTGGVPDGARSEPGRPETADGHGPVGSRLFTVMDHDAMVVGHLVESNLGGVAGGVAIRYDRTVIEATESSTQEDLLVNAAAVSGGFGLLILMGVFAAMSGIRRRLAAIEQRAAMLVSSMDDADGAGPMPAGSGAGPGPGSVPGSATGGASTPLRVGDPATDGVPAAATPLETDFYKFSTVAREAFGQIGQGRREIRHLDELDGVE